ncbi:MAG: beta-ketoacyl-[acyl-carrier-protein] synthase family protein [Deltaproteobacteria bacterium]|jgi:3-oxoacyl-[acyl-carrier-protein] synthase II|nr:beta-ketoacyl-[acyl-carrier-protein] synthase family protein [Deltaproteobacteria bacterium]
MRAPLNRRVFVIGYGAATPLGRTFSLSWQRAIKGEAGFRSISRCQVKTLSHVVGEIPEWDPLQLGLADEKDVYNWNAAFVILTVAICRQALEHAALVVDRHTGPKTACLIGSAINGSDALRCAVENLRERGPLKVSPYLLPNICANLPAGKAAMELGFTGPIFSPQGACASGNYALALGARMIRDGDCDFALVGGVDMPIIPEIIHGFANMNATIKIHPYDRAYGDPSQASRPFSLDRKGFVIAEGAGVLILAAEESIKAHGLHARAEVMGVGWSADAHHFTRPHKQTIIRTIVDAISDAGLTTDDIDYINAHGTSTMAGDSAEIDCLRTIFDKRLPRIPISSNKSQIGHSLGAAAAIENALTIEGMGQGILLPTINHLPDYHFDDLDFVPDTARRQHHEIALSNAFGFGGTNCCIVFRGCI